MPTHGQGCVRAVKANAMATERPARKGFRAIENREPGFLDGSQPIGNRDVPNQANAAQFTVPFIRRVYLPPAGGGFVGAWRWRVAPVCLFI